MRTEPQGGTVDAGVFHVQAVRDLQPLVDKTCKGLSPGAKDIFSDLVSKRPVTFWDVAYLTMARELAESIDLGAFYSRKEKEASYQGDIETAKEYSKLLAARQTLQRQLMITLQLTPTAVFGQARNHLGAVIQHEKALEIVNDIDEEDLYG